MKVSCCAYSYRDLLTQNKMSLDDFIHTAREIRVDAVELTSYYFPRTSDDYVYRLKRLVFQNGLDISGTAVGGRFTETDQKKLDQHVAMVKEWIDISQKLGAPVMRVFAGGIDKDADEEAVRARAVQAMRDCAAYGQSRGVLIAMENHGGITATAGMVLDLVRDVNHPWFGVNLDCGNYKSEDPYNEIEMTAPYAVATHAKVSIRRGDEREPVDYYRVAEILDRAGYNGYLSIEYEDPEDPVITIPRFAAYLRGIVR
ncbi:MAG: sugar phosphate isomerase/epimerase [Planctomycetes bacterium]|nr:sugar phosphate isomerase/epimerase [Planctomycetota bacterium]